MRTFKFLNKTAYQALVALSTGAASPEQAAAAAKLAAYNADVEKFKKEIGTIEVDLRIRKAIASGDNIILVTHTSENNPFFNGTVSISKKMFASWAADQKLNINAYGMLINQGQARITGTAFVVTTADKYTDKQDVEHNYTVASLRLENQSIELGGQYSKTIQTVIANAAVKSVMGAFDATDDAEINFAD